MLARMHKYTHAHTYARTYVFPDAISVGFFSSFLGRS